MSAHAEAPAAGHDAHAAPAVSHDAHAAPAAHAEHGHDAHAAPAAGGGYLSRIAGGVKDGVWNTLAGPVIEAGKAVVHPGSPHPWGKSVLAPLGGMAGAFARPLTAVTETFYHGGKLGFTPGNGWKEVVEIGRTGVHEVIDVARRGVNAVFSMADRMAFGAGEAVASLGGQGESPVDHLWKLPLRSSACSGTTWKRAA